MGGSIPFKLTSYNKQAQYLNPILNSWAATKSGRDRAMPHIKVRPESFVGDREGCFSFPFIYPDKAYFVFRWDPRTPSRRTHE